MSTPVIRQAVGAAASGANAVVTLGAGTAVGDLLLIFHGNDFFTAAGMPTPTSSQTLNSKTLQATSDQGTNQAHLKLWSAIVTVAGTQTVTGPVSSTEEVTCQVIVIDGSTVDTSNFIDNAVTTGGSTTSSTSHIAPAVSPVTADALLFCAAQSNGATGGVISYTPPGGMTERTDVNDGVFSAATTASLVLAASGTTGTKTFTCSASQGYATVSIAVKGGASGATASGPSLSSAQPGKTWKRRFQHKQARQPDTSIVTAPAVPDFIPSLMTRRRSNRRLPVPPRNLGFGDVPEPGLQPPVFRRFRSWKRRPALMVRSASISAPADVLFGLPAARRRRRKFPVYVTGDSYSPPPAQTTPPVNPSITQLVTGRIKAILRGQRRGETGADQFTPSSTADGPYRAAVRASSPSAWWHLDESSGGTFADSAGANPLTVGGTPTFGVANLEGPGGVGTATSFNNAGVVYGEAAASATFGGTASGLTVETLLDSNAVNGNNRIAECGADTIWALYFESGVLKFNVFGHGTAVYIWPGDTNRHHVVGSYEPSTGAIRLFVDGIEAANTIGSTGTLSSGANLFRIAQKPGSVTGSDGWNGVLDEVALYPSVLSPSTVAAHAAAAGLGTPPRWAWRAARRMVRPARGRVVLVSPVTTAAPANPSITQLVSGRVRQLLRAQRRADTGADQWSADQPVPPAAKTRAFRLRMVPRRGRVAGPTLPQDAPAQALRYVRRGWRFRRGSVALVTPPQQAVSTNPSITATTSVRGRLGARALRRGRVSNPTPAQQAAPVNPSITQLVGIRGRLGARALRRGKIAQWTPAQQAATPNPSITQLLTGRLRRIAAASRRAKVVDPTLDQDRPLSPREPARHYPAVRHGRVFTPIPGQQAAPTNPSISQTTGVRGRLGARALRRGKVANPTPAQVFLGNPVITALTSVGRLRSIYRRQPRPSAVTPVARQVNPPYPMKPSHVTSFKGMRPRGHSGVVVPVPPQDTTPARVSRQPGRGIRKIGLWIRGLVSAPVPPPTTTLSGPIKVSDSSGTVYSTEASRSTVTSTEFSASTVTSSEDSVPTVTSREASTGSVTSSEDSDDQVQP